MSSKRQLLRAMSIAAALAAASASPGYVFYLDDTNCVSTWRAGTIPMQVKLPATPTLSDGSNYRSTALAGMPLWNVHLGTVQFAGQGMAPGAYEIGNGTSEIVMDDGVNAGEESFQFDEYTLAITISLPDGNFIVESDIIINNTVAWDSFRGSKLGEKDDLRRVVTHELGHVLGLDHPDEVEPLRFVLALMNSIVSYSPPIEEPQADDIAGVQILYGYPGFVPQNDNLANAIPIVLTGANTTTSSNGTNVAATKQIGEPNLDPENPGGRTVWWKWTATYGGTVTVTSLGSNFDTLLGAYTGAAVDALTQIALNDDIDPGVIRQSSITLNVDIGTTYYFAVDGWDGYVGLIRLGFSVDPDPGRSPPIFAQRPMSRFALVGGGPVTFSAETRGSLTSTYSWKRVGTSMPGQTGSSLTIASPSVGDSGNYEVVATNSLGSSRSYFRLLVVPDDLTMVGWGNSSYGQATAPLGIGPLVSARLSTNFAVALRTDGTVAAWGNGAEGETQIPGGLTGVVAVEAGLSHGLALKSDGTMAAWGMPTVAGPGIIPAATIPPGLDQVIDIAGGDDRNSVLRADGTVVTWGEPFGRPQPAGIDRVVSVSASLTHTLALKSDGTVAGWGSHSFGEDTPPAGLDRVVAIAAGGGFTSAHSLALRDDGTVVAWGANNTGQCNVPAGLGGVVAISAGYGYSMALRSNGGIVVWGNNPYASQVPPVGLDPVFAIDAGVQTSLALVRGVAPQITSQPENITVNVGGTAVFRISAIGTVPLVYRWKLNGVVLVDGNGVSGSTTPTLTMTNLQTGGAGNVQAEVENAIGKALSEIVELRVAIPSEITLRPTSRAVLEGEAVSFSVAATDRGPFTYSWRRNRRTITGATGPTLEIGSAVSADEGYYEALVTNSEGGVSSTVFYLAVAIPNPTITTWHSAPPPPPYTGSITQIEVGGACMILQGDGKVLSWGTGDYGPTETPPGLENVIAVSSGWYHSIALKSDGSVVCWGDNSAGQCTPPGNLADVVAISAGLYHSMALRSNGTVVTWGNPLGAGTSTPNPGNPATVRNVVAVRATRFGYLALRSDGAVLAWGSQFIHPAPAGLSDVIAISELNGSYGALKADGTVVVWTDPVYPFESATDVVAISGGLVLKANGTVAYWQHGIGGPIPEGLEGVVRIASGYVGRMVLTRTRLPTIVAQAEPETATVGDLVLLKVQADGTPPMSYQWRLNGVPLADGNGVSGSTGTRLTLNPIRAEHAGVYDVVVTNRAGSVASTPAVVSLKIPPVVTQHPLSKLAAVGGDVSFSIAFSDPGPVTIRWRHNGLAIPDATGDTLSLNDISFADQGTYVVELTNSEATTVSVFALHVSPTDAADLSIAVWGDLTQGVSAVPQIPGEIVSIKAGDYHALALTGDGKVYAWGSADTGATAVPSGLVNVVAIAAGSYSSLALKADGTVVTWGTEWGVSNPPPDNLRGVAAIDLDGTENIAVRHDGTVVTWGVSTPPAGLAGVVEAVAVGGGCLSLKTDGTLESWGERLFGYVPPPDGLNDVAAISGGRSHALALKRDRTVVAWGENFGGKASVPVGLNDVVAIAAGGLQNIVLRRDGTFYSWGDSKSGATFPRLDLAGVAMVASGWNFNMALTSSTSAPRIVVDPRDSWLMAGQSVVLTCQTDGRPAPTVQWQKDGVDIPGAVSNRLVIPPMNAGHIGSYRLVATNPLGTATSASATLSMSTKVEPPRFSPAGGQVVADGVVTLSSPTFGAPIVYTIDGSVPNRSNGTRYYGLFVPPGDVLVRAMAYMDGYADSEVSSAQFEQVPNLVPEIDGAHLPRGVVGRPYTSSLTAVSGNGEPVWNIASGNLPAGLHMATSGVVSGVPYGAGTATVSVRVTDSDTVRWSYDEDVATLSITIDPTDSVPVITTASLPDAGLSLAYSANLAGSGGNGPLTWTKASGNLPPGLTISEGGLISGIPQALGTFTFTVRAADDDTITGAADEATKELSINVVPAPRLTNVSMRAFAGSGDDTLVVGFHIAGTGQKTVLIRGIGPKLLQYNVPSVVADPSITLYRDKDPLVTNNDWEASLAPVFIDAGAFALDVGSKDSAMTATLAPGGYTIHLVNNGPVAEALIEVYDISRDAGTRLVNVSSRLRFQPGQLAILGTAVTGGPLSVLARNVGPGIAEYLVNPLDALPDPHLRLYAGQTELAVNQDWDPALLPFFGAAGAFPLDEGSKDAAIRAQFQLGLYSVHATGNGGEGIAIIEIYESP